MQCRLHSSDHLRLSRSKMRIVDCLWSSSMLLSPHAAISETRWAVDIIVHGAKASRCGETRCMPALMASISRAGGCNHVCMMSKDEPEKAVAVRHSNSIRCRLFASSSTNTTFTRETRNAKNSYAFTQGTVVDAWEPYDKVAGDKARHFAFFNGPSPITHAAALPGQLVPRARASAKRVR